MVGPRGGDGNLVEVKFRLLVGAADESDPVECAHLPATERQVGVLASRAAGGRDVQAPAPGRIAAERGPDFEMHPLAEWHFAGQALCSAELPVADLE